MTSQGSQVQSLPRPPFSLCKIKRLTGQRRVALQGRLVQLNPKLFSSTPIAPRIPDRRASASNDMRCPAVRKSPRSAIHRPQPTPRAAPALHRTLLCCWLAAPAVAASGNIEDRPPGSLASRFTAPRVWAASTTIVISGDLGRRDRIQRRRRCRSSWARTSATIDKSPFLPSPDAQSQQHDDRHCDGRQEDRQT